LRNFIRTLTDSSPSNFRGILFMLAANLLFSIMGVSARYVSARIHAQVQALTT
jgi:hypothetical protein